MSVIVVDPNEKQPTHHVSLSDGVNTIGLIAVKPDGTPDITALRREPYPKSTLNSGGGEGALSTTKVPYGEVSRSEWFGGLGQLRADADRSKFLVGNSMWMLNNRAVLPAPKLFRSGFNITPGIPFPRPTLNKYYVRAGFYANAPLDSYAKMEAWRFTPTANTNLGVIAVDLSVIPPVTDAFQTVPGMEVRVKLELWSDDGTGTKPLAHIASSSIKKIAAPEGTVTVDFGSVAVTAGVNYWMVLRFGDPGGGYLPQDDTYPLYQTAAGLTNRYAETSDGGVSWTLPNGGTSQYEPFWQVLNTDYKSGLMFEYKHSLYAVVNPASSLVPKLYLNGDRGVATANANTTKVVDTTKSWATDKWAGAVVRIIDGPGKGEWARIISNTSNTLNTAGSFSSAVTTNSVYVIAFTGEWQEITGHGMTQPVKHVAVSNEETIYFAFGDAANIRRTRWYNNAGAWANAGWVDETTKADLIIFTWDQEKKSVLWRAVNGNKPYVARVVVPTWGTAITWETEIYIGDDAPIRALIYHDGKLIVRKESSMWGVLEGVPDILDIDMTSRYSDEHGINNMAVFSPYLLFPFQNKMQRLLGQLAENLGPPTMETDYAGEVVAMSPTLGMVFVGIRVENNPSHLNVSRVLVYKDGSWFPFCELPRGAVLLNIYFQRQDNGKDLLWILSTAGIFYIRVPRELDYKAALADFYDLGSFELMVNHFSSLAVGIFDMGNKILNKWWERLSYSDNGFKYVAYWTSTQSILYSYRYGQNIVDQPKILTWLPPIADNSVNIRIKSRRLGLLLTNINNDLSTNPLEYDGFNLSYLARVNDADMWLIPVNASDYDHDLNGIQEDLTAAQKLAIIDAWSRDVVPITMRSVDSQDDNKRVILGRQPKQYRRYQSELAGDPGQSKEGFYTSLVIYEVT